MKSDTSLMCSEVKALIDRLETEHSLSLDDYAFLIINRTEEAMQYIARKARRVRQETYGTDVYIRGLIEFSNFCRNNCLYCGIRRSNMNCSRYRLTKEQILACCDAGYESGFRTFVLQGGEDAFFTDEALCDILRRIKQRYPDCAVTLSVGERSRDSYQRLADAGADRYLLRHETADQKHYEALHPQDLSFENRMRCLQDLKEIGYQVGCGFMVGSPSQTENTLAKDLKFIETFAPDMCGIGPFIPHRDTPFKEEAAGTLEETLWLLSIIRLIQPNILLPATTALGTIYPGRSHLHSMLPGNVYSSVPDTENILQKQSAALDTDDLPELSGRELGILAGANVVMPNLSPVSVRKKYELYNNKICMDHEAAEGLNDLRRRMQAIGYQVVTDRGDIRRK